MTRYFVLKELAVWVGACFDMLLRAQWRCHYQDGREEKNTSVHEEKR